MTRFPSAVLIACLGAASSCANVASAQDIAEVTVVDRREPDDTKARRDSVFSAIAFLPDKAVKPSAVEQLKDALSQHAHAPVSIELTELRVIDYFPKRLKAGPGGGWLDQLIMKSLVNSRTDWSFVASIGIDNEVDSVICLVSGTLNGEPVKAAAFEPYQLGAFATMIRSDKHFRAAVSTCIDKVAVQMLVPPNAPQAE